MSHCPATHTVSNTPREDHTTWGLARRGVRFEGRERREGDARALAACTKRTEPAVPYSRANFATRSLAPKPEANRAYSCPCVYSLNDRGSVVLPRTKDTDFSECRVVTSIRCHVVLGSAIRAWSVYFSMRPVKLYLQMVSGKEDSLLDRILKGFLEIAVL